MMKTRTIRIITTAVSLSLLAAVAGIWTTNRVDAFHEVDRTLHTGMFGLAASQTARINLVNIGNPNDTNGACDAEMSFFDDRGNRLSRSRVQLLPGQSAFLDLRYSEMDRSGRAPVRAELVGFNPQPDPPGVIAPCISTVEVFDDQTGRTTLFLGGPDTVPGPIQ